MDLATFLFNICMLWSRLELVQWILSTPRNEEEDILIWYSQTGNKCRGRWLESAVADIHPKISTNIFAAFFTSLYRILPIAYFVFGNSIKLCLPWIEHSNDKFWIRTLRKGCLGFAELQCRNPQNIQLVLCPQLQHKTYSYFMFVHISKQFWLDRNSKLARYSNNLILKTRLSFLLCAAAIVKMVYSWLSLFQF